MGTRLLPPQATGRSGVRVTQLLLLFAALMALLLGGFTPMSPASHTAPDGNPGHCPDHQNAPKDNNPEAGDTNSLDVDGTAVWLHYSDDLLTVEFYADEDGTEPLAVDFCVKASNWNSGEHTDTSFTVDWVNNGGSVPEISYVVVYGIADGPPTVCPGENGDISLVHSDGSDDPATNDVNDPHSVTATVFDGEGNLCPGANVRFEVDSDGNPTPDGDTATTDDDGEAEFEYSNSVAGTDTITACTNADGSLPDSCADADHSASVTKIWEDGGVQAFFCRSDTATLSLVGDELLLLFEANGQSDPCENDADGLLYALDPILGPTGLLNDDQQLFLGQEGLGGLLLDVLWSRTDASDGAHANSGVLYLALNDGSDDQVILELLTSSNTTDSDCNTTTTATVLSLTLAGTPIEITGGNVVLIVEELDDLIILRLEDGNEGGADEGPDDTGAQAVDALILGAADLLGLTIADSESGCSG